MPKAHQLAQLMDHVKDANGWSDPKLVENARALGHDLSKSNISRYRKPLVSIKGEIIKALAAGLRIAPAQVAVAAIESMGIPLLAHDSPTPEQAVTLDTGLSVGDKRAVLALIEALRSSNGQWQAQSSNDPKGDWGGLGPGGDWPEDGEERRDLPQ